MQYVAGESEISPMKALALGPVRVIPSEFTNISARSIDVALPKAGTPKEARLIEILSAELAAKSDDTMVAYREGERWIRTFEPVRLDSTAGITGRIRERGVYLITGGLGGIGWTVAEHLAKTVRARLVLVGRSAKAKGDRAAVLEKLGAEVMIASADVTNVEAMRGSRSRCACAVRKDRRCDSRRRNAQRRADSFEDT